MKKFTLLAAMGVITASVAVAGTPTIDGTFDGVGVWGSPIATNSTPGFAGATATALYLTDDANYVYFGASVTGLQSWMTYGFAIDARAGGSNGPETWGRKSTTTSRVSETTMHPNLSSVVKWITVGLSATNGMVRHGRGLERISFRAVMHPPLTRTDLLRPGFPSRF